MKLYKCHKKASKQIVIFRKADKNLVMKLLGNLVVTIKYTFSNALRHPIVDIVLQKPMAPTLNMSTMT